MSYFSKWVRDNRANQLNPIHRAYYQSRGVASVEEAQLMADRRQNEQKTRTDQPDQRKVAQPTKGRKAPKASASSIPPTRKPS